MAYKRPSLVKQTSTTAGTGSLTLIAPATGATQSFEGWGGTPRIVRYWIRGASYYERGYGLFTAPSTLARTTIVKNSDGTTVALALPAGTHDVYIAFVGEPYVDSFTATKTLAVADEGNVQVLTGASNATLNLPAVAGLPDGFWFDALAAGTGVLTIDPNASETIDGAATFVLWPGQRARVFLDGAVWRFLSLSVSMNNAGRVGINTSAQTGYALSVADSGGAQTATFFKNDANASPTMAVINSDNTGNNILMYFYTDGATLRGSVDYNRAGTAIRYNTTSGAAQKQNIVPLPAEKLASLKAAALGAPLKEFEFITNPGEKTHGLVVEDILPLYPDCGRGVHERMVRDVISRKAIVDPETSELQFEDELGEPRPEEVPAQYDRSMWIFPLLALAQDQERRIAALEAVLQKAGLL